MPQVKGKKAATSDFERLLNANKTWSQQMRATDPDFFKRLCNSQHPEYLWIGCADSRVPANQIMGMAPGEVFVQRNVGNQALHTDMNYMSCLEYSVKALKVKNIIVCGHYNCGAVKAALTLPIHSPGVVNCWISDIRECRNQNEAELKLLESDPSAQLARMCELNVLRQVFHVATSSVVASAWAEGQELHVWGIIYSLDDGHVKRLAGPISADTEFEHNLEEFTHGPVSIQRCSDTGVLKMSINMSAEEAAALGSEGGASGSKPLDMRVHSEMRAAMNSVGLLDRINRHTAWGLAGAPAKKAAPAPPAPAKAAAPAPEKAAAPAPAKAAAPAPVAAPAKPAPAPVAAAPVEAAAGKPYSSWLGPVGLGAAALGTMIACRAQRD